MCFGKTQREAMRIICIHANSVCTRDSVEDTHAFPSKQKNLVQHILKMVLANASTCQDSLVFVFCCYCVCRRHGRSRAPAPAPHVNKV
jgi:hypothetical protein